MLKHLLLLLFLDKSEESKIGKKDLESEEKAGSSKMQESPGKLNPKGKTKNDSDSETQSTSCSDDSINDDQKKKKRNGPLDDLKFLDRTIHELIEIVDKDA